MLSNGRLGTDSDPSAQARPARLNLPYPFSLTFVGMSAHRFACAVAAVVMAAGPVIAAPGAARAAQPFVNLPYATWSDDEPSYRLYPGDDLDVVVPSAPELNKTVTVQPDGRIMVPLLAPQMAAGKNAGELEQSLSAAYSTQLLRPGVEVVVKAQPLKVFVGGEVSKPGVYDMPGDIDALRAIVQAGGFITGAKRSQVVIIRRGRDGRPMMRTVDFGHVDRRAQPDLVPLRRFDVVFVPRTGLAEVGDFMTQVRNALPVQFSYATSGIPF
jgi:polysaccharide export outer membrane protein